MSRLSSLVSAAEDQGRTKHQGPRTKDQAPATKDDFSFRGQVNRKRFELPGVSLSKANEQRAASGAVE